MKHAVMIIAHKNINQIIRLIRTVSSDNLHVFVHLDKKMDITSEEIDEIKNCSNNVNVLKKRISGILDTWSLVEIALELLKEAKKTEEKLGVKYNYFMLLSAQDYPIKSNIYIEDFLQDSYPKPLIDCTPYAKGNWVYKKFNSFGFYKVDSYINRKIDKGLLRKFIKLPYFTLAKLISAVKKTKNKINNPYNYKLYGGSAWWILPDLVVDFIFNEFKLNYSEVKKYKSTLTPEETFFQIMTMASPLYEMVELNNPEERSQNCMTYAHFTDEGKPFMGHPYILDRTDIDKLEKMPHLIARKFDTDIDEEILDLIDAKIINNS